MAQYIAVKARTLYALPPAVSFEQGCLVEPFAVGMHARTIDFPLQRCITEQIDVQFSYSSAGEYPVCLQAIAEGRADLTGLWQSFPLAEGAQVFDRLVHRDESLTKAVLIP